MRNLLSGDYLYLIPALIIALISNVIVFSEACAGKTFKYIKLYLPGALISFGLVIYVIYRGWY